VSRDERGSAALVVIAMLPLLIVVCAGVLQLGALRVVAARVAAAADLATLAAVDDQDETSLVANGALRLAPDAADVARQFFAANLAQVAGHLDVPPESAASAAQIAAFPDAPSIDPLTGWRYDRPTVRIAASVPVRMPIFGALLLPTIVNVSVRAASAAR